MMYDSDDHGPMPDTWVDLRQDVMKLKRELTHSLDDLVIDSVSLGIQCMFTPFINSS